MSRALEKEMLMNINAFMCFGTSICVRLPKPRQFLRHHIRWQTGNKISRGSERSKIHMFGQNQSQHCMNNSAEETVPECILFMLMRLS